MINQQIASMSVVVDEMLGGLGCIQGEFRCASVSGPALNLCDQL